MVLRYMVSDTDLASGKAVQPQRQIVQPKEEVAQPKRSISSPPKKRAKFWFLLVANMIVWTVVYYFWAVDRGMVGGVIYNTENPSALVRGELVHEGETIDGYKVIKIHRDRVVLEKDGKYVTRWVD